MIFNQLSCNELQEPIFGEADFINKEHVFALYSHFLQNHPAKKAERLSYGR
jgi:hypothetical protein